MQCLWLKVSWHHSAEVKQRLAVHTCDWSLVQSNKTDVLCNYTIIYWASHGSLPSHITTPMQKHPHSAEYRWKPHYIIQWMSQGGTQSICSNHKVLHQEVPPHMAGCVYIRLPPFPPTHDEVSWLHYGLHSDPFSTELKAMKCVKEIQHTFNICSTYFHKSAQFHWDHLAYNISGTFTDTKLKWLLRAEGDDY